MVAMVAAAETAGRPMVLPRHLELYIYIYIYIQIVIITTIILIVMIIPICPPHVTDVIPYNKKSFSNQKKTMVRWP